MAKATMEEVAELVAQANKGRITSEVIQEVLQNANKMNLKGLFARHIAKAQRLLERIPRFEEGRHEVIMDITVALAEMGNVGESFEMLGSIHVSSRKARAFMQIAKVLEENGSHSDSDTIEKKALEVARKIEGSWLKVNVLLDIYETFENDGAILQEAMEVAIRVDDPSDDYDKGVAYRLAVALFKHGADPHATGFAKAVGRENELDVERVKKFLDGGQLNTAIEIAERIEDIHARIDAFSAIVIHHKEERYCISDLEKAVKSLPAVPGTAFVYAQYAKTLAIAGVMHEAEEVAERLSGAPGPQAKAFQALSEAYLDIYSDVDRAMYFAKKAGHEYNCRSNALAHIARWHAACGNFAKAREVARMIGKDYYLLFEVYAYIGQQSGEDRDFEEAFGLIDREKRRPIVPYERMAKNLAILCQYIARRYKIEKR